MEQVYAYGYTNQLIIQNRINQVNAGNEGDVTKFSIDNFIDK